MPTIRALGKARKPPRPPRSPKFGLDPHCLLDRAYAFGPTSPVSEILPLVYIIYLIRRIVSPAKPPPEPNENAVPDGDALPLKMRPRGRWERKPMWVGRGMSSVSAQGATHPSRRT